VRKLRFRAWDKQQKKMYPGPFSIIGETTMFDLLKQWSVDALNDLEIMQSTGLTDKNGLGDIWEGDIIGLDGQKKGNRHENPSLLEEKTNLVIEGMGTEAWRSTEQKAVERGCSYPK